MCAATVATLLGFGHGVPAAETPVGAGDARRTPHRNVVLIISDDQHWRDYGFMGHEHLRTPHLDRLARESLVYRCGHVPSSLCCPSLASIITGRLPHEHRIVGNDPPEDPRIPRTGPEGRAAFTAGREAMNRHLEEWPLLPRLLADHGYESLQTGKWWQGDFARGGFTQGMSKGQRHGDEGQNLAASEPEIVRQLTQSLVANWPPHGPPHGSRAAAATPPAAAAAKRPPNLLVFLADDLGAGDLGCTGSTFYRTPAIDRLAASGMRFTRGYAAAPVCSPTRTALMTGRHPARVKITNFIDGNRRGSLLPADYLHALPASEVTVPELLHDAGYATGIFGKWHLGPPKDIPSHGFDVTGSTNVGPGGGPPDDTHHARAIAAEASAFITANRDQPFFCYVPMHSVHVPLKTRPELLAEEQTRAAALPPPAGPREVAEGDRMARAVQDHPVYAGMIREMDETVATVLAAVEAAGQTDNTLVVFTSDNGGLSTAEGSPTSNLPLRAGKGFLYEGGIRVPLVVRWPGIVEPGTTTDVPVTTLDIAATLLDVGGTKQPAEAVLDGTSLRPVLAGGALPARDLCRDLCWHYPHYANQGGRPAAAIIAGDGPSQGNKNQGKENQGNEKLVEHFEDGRVELFDLESDPGERRDLAAERPERAAVLKERLAAWRARIGAAMPSPNPQPVDPFGPEGEPTRR